MMSVIEREDFSFNVNEIDYVIRNVPVEHYTSYDEGSIDLWSAIKVSMIRDLMIAGKIPSDVDFKEIEDIKYEEEVE